MATGLRMPSSQKKFQQYSDLRTNKKRIDQCDEIEQIPENMHWITDPAGTVFILKTK